MIPAHSPLPGLFASAKWTLFLCGLSVLSACGDSQPIVSTGRPVLTHLISATTTSPPVTYAGEVRSRHETALAFRVSGKIVSRHVDLGAQVKPGQVLARLDPNDGNLAVAQAQATLAAADAERNFAKAELERTRDLRAKNFVSQTAFEAKQTQFDAAQAKWQAVRAQAEVSFNQRAYMELKADQAGVISLVTAEPGQVVAPGQSVFRLARPDTLEVAINVPESRVREFSTGATAEITLWAHDGKHYAGRLRELSPAADAATRTYSARVAITDADASILLGMTANVSFKHKAEAGQIGVPLSALFQQQDKPAVWVVGADQTVSLRPVKVAAMGEEGALISAGLQPGERIVLAGVHKLTQGEKVRLLETAPAQTEIKK